MDASDGDEYYQTLATARAAAEEGGGMKTGEKRFVVRKAKGIFGVIRWHVWDTEPDFCCGHSMMEADDKTSCEEHAKELEEFHAEKHRPGPHIRKQNPRRRRTSRNWVALEGYETEQAATLCGAPCTDKDATIYQAGCKTWYGHVKCGKCLAVLRAMKKEGR